MGSFTQKWADRLERISPRWHRLIVSVIFVSLAGALVPYLRDTRPQAAANAPEAPSQVEKPAERPSTPQKFELPTPHLAIPDSKPRKVQNPEPAQSLAPPAYDPNNLRRADERVIFHTVAGDLVLAFYPDVAPRTVEQIIRLVKLGVFDTTHFGRLEPGFVLQVNNADDRLFPLTDIQLEAQQPVKGEFGALKHRRGLLSMAREDGKPDSAVSSFSMLLGNAPHLDGHYAIFGEIESGLDVLERLEEVPRSTGSRPEVRLTILQAEVVKAADLKNIKLVGPRPLIDVLAKTPSPWLTERAHRVLKDNCLHCHGGDKTKGGLSLISRNSLKKGGEGGPVIDESSAAASSLLQRITGAELPAMPPGDKRLSVAEVGLMAAWLHYGAPYPGDSGSSDGHPLPQVSKPERRVTAKEADFWSFRPFQPIKPPGVNNAAWVRSPIDRFILAKLEAKQLVSNAEADKRTLHRRLSFDLLGLPPDPKEMEVFLADTKPDAYGRLVDRLLASPHFGERWGRHWLDLVRYADSDGYENDYARPHAYPYRDFVIKAFNDDLPFDVFLRWQLAGDEIDWHNPQAVAATGFCTAGPLQTFKPSKKDRYDELDDIVATTGSAMLGLTVGCARCHDHKHDPISSKDYYRLTAVFAGTSRKVRYLTEDGGAGYLNRAKVSDKKQLEFDEFLKPIKERIRHHRIGQLPLTDDEKELLRAPLNEANPVQNRLYVKNDENLQVAYKDIPPFLEGAEANEWNRLTGEINKLEQELGPQPLVGLSLYGSGVTKAFFLDRGDANREVEIVPPGFLTVLTKDQPTWEGDTWKAYTTSQNALPRTALANWLTDVDCGAGRLAARVIVNRLWQHHFGEGLVRTPNDFGNKGEPPSHAELLDWLAQDLVNHGWQLKRLHKMIVCSAVYRQDGKQDAEKVKADPDNRLLGRRTLQRLSADALRDAILATSGALNRQRGGPGIKPPIPKEAIFITSAKHGEVWPSDAKEGTETWRRSVYLFAQRSNPIPFLQLFDGPDAATTCPMRSATTVPTQALALLNDPFLHHQAQLLADRVKGKDNKLAEAIRKAFALALSRAPADEEVSKALTFLRRQALHYAQDADYQALVDFCQVLFQTNEFIYVE